MPACSSFPHLVRGSGLRGSGTIPSATRMAPAWLGYSPPPTNQRLPWPRRKQMQPRRKRLRPVRTSAQRGHTRPVTGRGCGRSSWVRDPLLPLLLLIGAVTPKTVDAASWPRTLIHGGISPAGKPPTDEAVAALQIEAGQLREAAAEARSTAAAASVPIWSFD